MESCLLKTTVFHLSNIILLWLIIIVNYINKNTNNKEKCGNKVVEKVMYTLVNRIEHFQVNVFDCCAENRTKHPY